MEATLVSSTQHVECGLRRICCIAKVGSLHALFGLFDGRIFYASVTHEDVTVLQDFDANPEQHGSPLRDLRFVDPLDIALTDTFDGALWVHLRDSQSNTFFPAFTVATSQDGSDVLVVDEECLVAIIQSQDSLVGVARVTRLQCDMLSSFECPEGYHHPERVKWATPGLLALLRGTQIALVGLDGVLVSVFSDSRCPPLVAPLGHSFVMNDQQGVTAYASEFVIAWECGEGYLRNRATVLTTSESSVSVLRTFPLLCEQVPSDIAFFGPWLVVSSAHGLEFYEHSSGRFAQAALEESNVAVCSLSTQVACTSPNRRIFFESTLCLCIAAPREHIMVVNLLPIRAVVGELLGNAVFEMDRIEMLMQFGHSVGARTLVPRDAQVAYNEHSFMFTAYGKLISRCIRENDGDSVGDASSNSNLSPRRDVCPKCAKALSKLGGVRRCSLCNVRTCGGCCRKVSSADLGLGLQCQGAWSASSLKQPYVCADCDGASDQNLLLLLLARRYAQIIRYVAKFPDRCFKFQLDEVITLCMEQCFAEKKYESCARLICRYVVSQELWETWLMNFSLAGSLGVLVDMMPDSASETAGTTVLLQLVKHDAGRLFSVLRRWKQCSPADRTVVQLGIEARLRAKQRDATATFTSCVTTAAQLAPGDHGAAHAWYFTKEVEHLMLALICIVGGQEDHTKDTETCLAVATLYLENYLEWAPAGEFFSDTRRRSASFFEGRPSAVFAPARCVELLDFWELFTGNNRLLAALLERKCISKASGVPLFIPLARHYRVELCKLLCSYDTSKSSDLIESIVEQLEPYPAELLKFLHQLTTISPLKTARYHPTLANLYLELEPEQLLPFVRNRSVENLNWLKLAAQVEQRRMFPELVYIIGRTGNDKEAVRIALRCLQDVSLAIQYVVDSEDRGLWEEAIAHVIQSEELIGQFLAVVGDRFDPSVFLRKIPAENRLRITQLGPRLGGLVVDRKSSVGISKAYLGTLEGESMAALKKLRRVSQQGTRVAAYSRCFLCKARVVEHNAVIGKRGCAHERCFYAAFCRAEAPREICKKTLFEMTLYETNRRCKIYDITELLPMRVLSIILSQLGPYSRLCCELVSSRWRRVFGELRRFALTDTTYLFAVHRKKTLSKTSPSLADTVHTVALERYGEYRLREKINDTKYNQVALE